MRARRKEVKRRKPPNYRVLLHNDNYNKREYVVRVLLKVVDGFTVDEAVNCMQASIQIELCSALPSLLQCFGTLW